MLRITVPAQELFDDETQTFLETESLFIELEHSLVSLSKWESFFEKPFLSDKQKTVEETLKYVEFMILDENVDTSVVSRLSNENLKEINEYISSKMTATWFKDAPGRTAGSREVITAEIIYYWMISLNVPIEYETRHLNQLITLIKVLNEKNQPQKKMSKQEALARQRSLNKARQAQYGTRG